MLFLCRENIIKDQVLIMSTALTNWRDMSNKCHSKLCLINGKRVAGKKKNADISNAGFYRREEKRACKKDIVSWGLEPPRSSN